MGDRFYCQRDRITIGHQPDRKVRTPGVADYFKFFPELNKNPLYAKSSKPAKVKQVTPVYVSKKNEPSMEDLIKALMGVK